MRFVESLARWLVQFGTVDERRIAYDFVKNRLIFCSSAEMSHLVEMAYPDHIRPMLLRRVAEETRGNPRHAAKVAGSVPFRMRQRQCLFLGGIAPASPLCHHDVRCTNGNKRRCGNGSHTEPNWLNPGLDESKMRRAICRCATASP
jgi:hypothetical protein